MRFIQISKNYVLEFLKIQLFVTLISLPFLIFWGLPFSIMTFVGNLIFTPVLGLFLLLSSLLFFTELFHIPNGALIKPFEMLCSTWDYLLTFGKKEWMVGFAQPHILIVLAIPVITLIITRYKKQLSLITIIKRLFVTVLVIFGLLAAYSAFMTLVESKQNPCNDLLEIERAPNKSISIIDKGFFNKRPNAYNTITYELKPYLLKNYGTTAIHKFILSKPGARTFLALIELTKTCSIETVCLPYFKEELNKYDWKCFFDMKRELAKLDIRFERLQSVRSPAGKPTRPRRRRSSLQASHTATPNKRPAVSGIASGDAGSDFESEGFKIISKGPNGRARRPIRPRHRRS